MHKGRAGLQKEISKIFTGVQIPGKGAAVTNAPSAPAQPAKYVPPKTSSPKPAPAPKPFTIPEPYANPPAVSLPSQPQQQTVAVTKQTIYEPPPVPAPAFSPSTERQPRIEQLPKPTRQLPFLKIFEQVKNKLFSTKPGANQKKQKIMILMTPVLVMAFIFVLTQVLRSPSKTAVNATKAANAANAPFNGKIDWSLPPLYPETLRDPMSASTSFSQTQTQAQAQAQDTTPRPIVKGIVYSEDNPCAVVGDRIVSAGDEVDGATVVKINPDSVEFAAGDKKWTQKVER
jgi:MSHA biogenesis protein MshK